jgi:hypothetical protein
VFCDLRMDLQMTAIYERIKTSIHSAFELELGPLMKHMTSCIRAALTEEGGKPPDTCPERAAAAAANYVRGMQVVRGPDWKWGNQVRPLLPWRDFKVRPLLPWHDFQVRPLLPWHDLWLGFPGCSGY